MRQKTLAGVISLVILIGRLSTDALKPDRSTSLMTKMVEYSAKGVNETFTAEDVSLFPSQLAGMGEAAFISVASVVGLTFVGLCCCKVSSRYFAKQYDSVRRVIPMNV